MSIAQQIMSNPGRYSIQELQQGMNSGVVPAYIAVPLIQQKVQEQQQFQLAQMAQGAPQQNAPTVAEEVLAQAEQAQGVDALPTNLPEETYAPGGIVAFDEGGEVPGYALGGLKIPEDYELVSLSPELEEAQEGIAALAPYAYSDIETPQSEDDRAIAAVKRFRELTKDLPSSKADRDALRAALTAQAEGSEERAKRDQALLAVKTAADILGGTSQYGAVNVGQGVGKAIPDLMAQETARRQAEIQNLMARSQLSGQERAEEMEAITGGMGLYKTELEEGSRVAAAKARVAAERIRAGKDRDTRGDRAVRAIADSMAQNQFGVSLSELDPAKQRVILGAAERDYATLQARITAGASMYGVNVREGTESRKINQDAWQGAQRSLDAALRDDRKLNRAYQKARAEGWGETWYSNELRQRYNLDPNIPSTLPIVPQPGAAPSAPVKQAAPTTGTKPRVTYAGKTYEFATQEQANAFKKAVGQ